MVKCKDSLPEIMSLNSGELIDWMRKRKSDMGLSNAKLASLSGVPEGTIDRIMSKHYTEFRYSSIQPIMAVLIGTQEITPEPDPTDEEQNEFYYNTIEGYKLAMENKNHEIRQLKTMYELLCEENAYLKQNNKEKQEIIERRAAHEKWLESILDEVRAQRR